MIAYSKGNYDVLLDTNPLWSMMFIIIYYFIAIFVIHAALHMTQTDALKNVVMMFSLEEDDVPPKQKKVEENVGKKVDPAKEAILLFNQSVNNATKWIKWLLGWTNK